MAGDSSRELGAPLSPWRVKQWDHREAEGSGSSELVKLREAKLSLSARMQVLDSLNPSLVEERLPTKESEQMLPWLKVQRKHSLALRGDGRGSQLCPGSLHPCPSLSSISEQISRRQSQVDRLYVALKELGEERRVGLEQQYWLYQLSRQVDELEHWIAEKEVVAGSPELGQDFEHVTVSIIRNNINTRGSCVCY